MTLVQHEREKAGLSIVEVAKRSGLRFSTIWKIEHEQRKLLATDLVPLAAAIGCPTDALIPKVAACVEEPVHV